VKLATVLRGGQPVHESHVDTEAAQPPPAIQTQQPTGILGLPTECDRWPEGQRRTPRGGQDTPSTVRAKHRESMGAA